MKKSTATFIYSGPSSDFDVSFSTKEFLIGYRSKGNSASGPSLNTHTTFPQDTSASTNAPSFSTLISMSADQTGDLPSSNAFAGTNSTSDDNTGGYNTTIHLTTANSLDSQQKIHPTVNTSISQHQQGQNQRHVDTSAPLETTATNDSEVGTVDYILKHNDMGFGDWDIKPEELNRLFNDKAETGDHTIPESYLSHHCMHPTLPHFKNIAVTTAMAPATHFDFSSQQS